LYASGGRVDISGSLYINGSPISGGSAFPYTGSAEITGSLKVNGPINIGANWRFIESASNLVVEKWNGSAWVNSGIFS